METVLNYALHIFDLMSAIGIDTVKFIEIATHFAASIGALTDPKPF